jgi:hypothetical protein
MRRSPIAFVRGACTAARSIAMSVEGWPSGVRHGKADDAGPAAGCGQGAGRLGLQQLGTAARPRTLPTSARRPPEPDDGRRELAFQTGWARVMSWLRAAPQGKARRRRASARIHAGRGALS